MRFILLDWDNGIFCISKALFLRYRFKELEVKVKGVKQTNKGIHIYGYTHSKEARKKTIPLIQYYLGSDFYRELHNARYGRNRLFNTKRTWEGRLIMVEKEGFISKVCELILRGV